MSEMKKVMLAAAVLGILLGTTIFFSSPSMGTAGTESRQVMLQNSGLPPTTPEAVAVHETYSEWPVVIGFLLGGLVGFGTFLVVKRRA